MLLSLFTLYLSYALRFNFHIEIEFLKSGDVPKTSCMVFKYSDKLKIEKINKKIDLFTHYNWGGSGGVGRLRIPPLKDNNES